MNFSHNLALSDSRNRWLHHPVLGDPSWDAFERESELPLFEGSPPLEWPVNGFLFLDPQSQRWHAYISQYPRKYWGLGAGTRLLREDAPGVWSDLGTVLNGNSTSFDAEDGRPGLTVDPSLVYADGIYHLVFGWASPENQRGGLGYAKAMRPEGPFEISPTPIHLDTTQPLLLERYQRAYAPTVLRREHDWLILHMISTPQNLRGGTWALCAMTAAQPAGPYGPLTFLLYPQSEVYHPPLLEFYPAFVHHDRVYAPATSLAANRSYQALYAADLERAHLPEAWHLEQSGSFWHETLHPSEAVGIWGQTVAAQVSPDGQLRALSFSRSSEDLGTVHVARRRWAEPHRESFVLAAPNAASHATLRSNYRTFALELAGTSRGSWTLAWGCTGPLGPNQVDADAVPHAALRWERYELRLDGKAVFFDARGQAHPLGQSPAPLTLPLRLEQSEADVTLWLEGEIAWRVPLPARTGRLELIAETGTLLEITRFVVTGTTEVSWERWLALEGMLGAAAPEGEWTEAMGTDFCYGFGLSSQTPGARLKWNCEGQAVRLLAPRGPQYGQGEVWIDGLRRTEVNFYHPESQSSAVVFEAALEPGRHAISLRITQGLVPADLLEVLP